MFMLGRVGKKSLGMVDLMKHPYVSYHFTHIVEPQISVPQIIQTLLSSSSRLGKCSVIGDGLRISI